MPINFSCSGALRALFGGQSPPRVVSHSVLLTRGYFSVALRAGKIAPKSVSNARCHCIKSETIPKQFQRDSVFSSHIILKPHPRFTIFYPQILEKRLFYFTNGCSTIFTVSSSRHQAPGVIRPMAGKRKNAVPTISSTPVVLILVSTVFPYG